MAKLKQVVIGDKKIKIGDKLRINGSGQGNGIGPSGVTTTVRYIKEAGEIMIGLSSPNRLDGWGDLDGMVDRRKGFWATRDTIIDCFDLVETEFLITEDYAFKNRNLKGMKANLIFQSKHADDCFIELDEDVGGGCADGLGKTGHCIVVPAKVLAKQSSREKLKAIKAKPIVTDEERQPAFYDNVTFEVAAPDVKITVASVEEADEDVASFGSHTDRET